MLDCCGVGDVGRFVCGRRGRFVCLFVICAVVDCGVWVFWCERSAVFLVVHFAFCSLWIVSDARCVGAMLLVSSDARWW